MSVRILNKTRTASRLVGTGPAKIASHHDDPLDGTLTADDITMLGFALLSILGAITLLALGI